MSEQSFEMIAKTFQGLEETLAQELTSLGANEIQIGRRMVSFCGDKEMMYKANFCLRTATGKTIWMLTKLSQWTQLCSARNSVIQSLFPIK